MRTKRILSIVLTLAMLLGMFLGMSLTASAAGDTPTNTTITPGSDDAKTGTGTMTITLKIKAAQTITASDVTATYGDTDKSVSASVTTPATGGGTISYAVKEGSGDYIDVAADGKLTIKAVPPTDGKAYVIVTAAATDDYAETTKEVTVTISKAEVTVTALNQSIMVGGTVPDLSAPVLNTHYSVTGLVGEDTLTTAPTLAYQKNGSAATPDSATAGTYDIVPSGASAGDNYTVSYTNGTLTITTKDTQTITASDVTATYGDTDKNVSATTDGNGEISYTVKAGSENYIDVNASTGALTIKAVPADGKAYVTVTASETNTGGTGGKGYAAATKDVTVNISKATVTIAAKDQSIYVGGTVPTLEGENFYTVTGLVGEDALTTAPVLAYQKDGSAATPDNTAAGTYDIVASGASAGDNYTINYTKGTLTISDKGTQTITADDVTVAYGDTDKKVSASVTDPTEGSGAISYAVKDGSGYYIDVDASTGALTIKKVPADGKAYVTVTAAGTAAYEQATKDVTVTINKASIDPTVKMDGWTAGETAKEPSLKDGSNPGNGTVTYTYAKKGENKFTSGKPTTAGQYTVKAEIAETDNYKGGSATADFTIDEAKPEEKPTTTEEKTEEKPEQKSDAVVTTAPKAKKLTYNGKAQELVKAGKATGGKMQYALGKKTKATGSYSADIPTGTKAGTYYVWYKVKGDKNHNDTKAACVKVTIAEAKKEQKTETKPFTDFRTLRLVAKRGTKSVNLTWRKYADADGYLIYGCECGAGSKMKLLKTIKGNKTVKWTHKKLKKATYYKYKVVAYKNEKGKKKVLVNSVAAHTITHDGKTTAVKAVKVNKTSVSLKKGQTFQIKASETKENKHKKIDHHREISYESSNKKVATVNQKGKVKGVKKGTATIFVYSETGHYKTVKVTVK